MGADPIAVGGSSDIRSQVTNQIAAIPASMIRGSLDAQIDIQFVKEISEFAAAAAQGNRRRNPVAAKPEYGGHEPSRNVCKSEMCGMRE